MLNDIFLSLFSLASFTKKPNTMKHGSPTHAALLHVGAYKTNLLTSYAGGRGVYTARIMLGIEPFENELAYRTSSPNTGKKTMTAFPNPAGQMVTFRFDEIPEKESAAIEIHSIGGKMVLSVRVQPLETEYTTALNNLPNGIFVARIIYANGDQASVKLVKYQ